MNQEQPPGGWQQPPPSPQPFAGQYASWWARAGAFLIDALIIAVPVVVLVLIFMLPLLGALGLWGSGSEAAGGAYAAVSIIGLVALAIAASLMTFLIRLLYGAILMQRGGEHNGQTWGKQLLEIRAVRADGQPYDFGSALLRDGVVEYLLFWVVGGFLFYVPTLLNYLWPLWDDQNRCLHDLMVDSRVIRT
jgi:uncharacterized RDD family membrane protein YckC